MRALIFVFALVGTPAAALEYCEELWFARNMMFHKAGYCFGSNLGKAVYGNFNCVGKDVSLSEEDNAFLGLVRKAEAAENCRIDTKAGSLSVSLPEDRKALEQQPFPSLFESSCLGWKGDPLPLHIARDQTSSALGQVSTGDALLFQYEDVDGWSFVEVMQAGEVTNVGWTKVNINEDVCTLIAG